MQIPFIYNLMITRLVKLTLKPEFCSTFEQIFVDRHNAIKSQPGCFGVELVKDIKETGVFFTISKWQSEKDLNAYRHSDLFKDIWPTVKPMFADKAEAWSTEFC